MSMDEEYQFTVNMLAKKILVNNDKLIQPNENCKDELFEKDEVKSDELKPDGKKKKRSRTYFFGLQDKSCLYLKETFNIELTIICKRIHAASYKKRFFTYLGRRNKKGRIYMYDK